MESFELGKEIERYFCVLSRARDKGKILSPHEESNLRPSDSTLRCSTTEPRRLYSKRLYGPYEVYYEVHMTNVLYTARISNVDSSIFVNIIREMVSVELGKEIEKDVFASCHERGTRKKF